MPAPVLQLKRGQWSQLPGLRAGEPGFTTDTYDLYVGINSTTIDNKFFGSHRYWGREDGTNSLKLKFVDKSGNNAIHLKSPNTLSGIGTYTLPNPNSIVSGYFLTVDSLGNLSWANSFSNSQVLNGVFSGISTFLGFIYANSGIDVTGHSEFDNINVSGIATIANANFNTINVLGISTFQSNVNFYGNLTGTISTSTRAVSVDVLNNATNSSLFYPVFVNTFSGENSETLYVNNTVSLNPFNGNLNIDGDLKVSGNNIIDSGGVNALTFDGLGNVSVSGDIRVNGGDIRASDGQPNISMISNTLTEVKGELQISGNSIKSSSSSAVLSLSGSDGRFLNNLTVDGNFYVKGTTTEVNSVSLKVEDRTIDLGMVDGLPPGFPTTWDLGILFNYYTTSAKKSAVVWEHSNSRFQFATEISDVEGTNLNTPQISVGSFAPIEISSLWVTDCAGTSKVVDCVSGERVLENIVLDAGSY